MTARGLLSISVLLVSTTIPRALHTQVVSEGSWTAPRWTGHVTFAAANSILAGLGAGITAQINGRAFSPAFTKGAAGGALSYVGRVVSSRHDLGGFAGRQIGAVGASVIDNAAKGEGIFATLYVPLGPVNVYVRTASGGIIAKVNLATTIAVVSAALDDDLRFHLGHSLSTGAPVFTARGQLIREDGTINGLATSGIIVLSANVIDSKVLSHERVHTGQQDIIWTLVDRQVEPWLLQKLQLAHLNRYLDFNGASVALRYSVRNLIDLPTEERPVELEANFLERR